MTAYERVADRPVTIEGYALSPRERETSRGEPRRTTVISLKGDGETGLGEDVTYEAEEHERLLDHDGDFPIEGEYTVREASAAIGDIDLFPAGDPDRSVYRHYRRWGFEAAVLDLALRQADTDLASALDREYAPLRFVTSMGLGDPPTTDRVDAWREIDPDLEFKLDATPEWDPDLTWALADTGRVRVIDFKGQYEGTVVDQPPDPDLYRRVVEAFPDAVLEDPALTGETEGALEDDRDRVSWDAPIESVADIEALPWEPDWLNIKPSRFGALEEVLAAIEHCFEHGIRMYSGGQSELDVGRGQSQALSSLFFPDAPNDIAPSAYNDPDPRPGLPGSPLDPPADPIGFRWAN